MSLLQVEMYASVTIYINDDDDDDYDDNEEDNKDDDDFMTFMSWFPIVLIPLSYGWNAVDKVQNTT